MTLSALAVVPLTVPTLTGDMVRLEPLTADHAIELAEVASEDPGCFGHSEVPCDKIAMHTWVTEAIHERNPHDPLPYAIRRLSDGRLVGSTRFWRAEFWSRPTANDGLPSHTPDTVEIGKTWFGACAQRTGCNTDAKYLMLRHAFESWKVKRVTMTADSRDGRARLSIEKLGARLDGVLRAVGPTHDDSIGSVAIYTILDHEWPWVARNLEHRLRNNAVVDVR